jgi:hypothetical protein
LPREAERKRGAGFWHNRSQKDSRRLVAISVFGELCKSFWNVRVERVEVKTKRGVPEEVQVPECTT